MSTDYIGPPNPLQPKVAHIVAAWTEVQFEYFEYYCCQLIRRLTQVLLYGEHISSAGIIKVSDE